MLDVDLIDQNDDDAVDEGHSDLKPVDAMCGTLVCLSALSRHDDVRGCCLLLA